MRSFVSLMYHDVVDYRAASPELSPSVTQYFVGRGAFEAQIAELAACGRCLDWETFRAFYDDGETADGDGQPSRPLVQVTLDDGWLGSVDSAGPVLEAHGWEGILFVTTDLISRPGFVSPSDLQSLPNRVLRVGSHSRTHRPLNRLRDKDIREELQTSRLLLEDIVGCEVDAFSVPGGALDERVRRIAVETGYRYVFTSNVHANTQRSGPTDIGRIAIRRTTSLKDVRRYVRHRFRREQLRQQAIRFGKQVLSAHLYEWLRRRLLGERKSQYDMTDLADSGRQERQKASIGEQ